MTATEWFFQGHFPGLPVMPGVLQVEALAQTMAVYVARAARASATGSGCSPASTRSASSGSSCPATRSASRSRWRSSGRRFGKGRARATVDGEVACEGLLSASSSRRPGPCDDPPRGPVRHPRQRDRRSRRSSRTSPPSKPDAVLIAGDLVLNGPEPAPRRRRAALAADRHDASIVQGNTDIAVADFDYAAAFPWMTDGVPDAIQDAAEWAHDALGDERLDWLRRLPAERRWRDRRRHARPRLPRLAGLADGGLRPGPRPDRDHRARRPDRRPGHRLRPHPPARGPRPRLEAHRQRRARPATSSTASRRPRGRSSTSTTTTSAPRSAGPSSTRSPWPTRSPPAAWPATSTAPPRSAPDGSSDERRVASSSPGWAWSPPSGRTSPAPGTGLVAGRSGVGTITAFDPSRADRPDRGRGQGLRRQPTCSTARTCGGPTATSSSGSSPPARRWTRPGCRSASRASWPRRPGSSSAPGSAASGTLDRRASRTNALRGPDRISPFLIPMGIPNIGAGPDRHQLRDDRPQLRDGVRLRHAAATPSARRRRSSGAATPT